MEDEFVFIDKKAKNKVNLSLLTRFSVGLARLAAREEARGS
jgi:hypothetical protein